ncbi:hypothetical protein L0222_14830 [bacterium]|nr:hypothetical protein [bacterium]MCI0603681.1 hypothetical protein [bacterium]
MKRLTFTVLAIPTQIYSAEMAGEEILSREPMKNELEKVSMAVRTKFQRLQGSVRENQDFKKVFRTNPHAMVLAGLRFYKNEMGKQEEYFVFRDSGYYEGSRFARVPVRETCRVLTGVAVITDEDAARAKSGPPSGEGPHPAFLKNAKDIRKYLAGQTLTCGFPFATRNQRDQESFYDRLFTNA